MQCLKRREREYPKEQKRGSGAFSVIAQILRDKKKRGPLKYNSFLCFTVLSTCLYTIMHRRKSDRQNEHTHKRQSRLRIKFSSYLDQRPALAHTRTTHILNGVAVRQRSLGHKPRRGFLRRSLNGWFIWGPNQTVVGTLYASVWSHSHQNGHLSFREAL